MLRQERGRPMLRHMHMLRSAVVFGVGLILALTACTEDAPVSPPVPPASIPTEVPARPSAEAPPLGLLDVALTCDRRSERTADGTVRGRVVGLRSAVPHEVNVVQGADAVLGGARLPAADAAGAVAFQVPVEKVLADQPVRVLLRQSGVRSVSVQVEIAADSASCAPR